MSALKILGFAGSLRRNSYNRSALRAAQALAPSDVKVDIFDLNGIPVFNEDEEANPANIVVEFRKKISDADAILIATPEYNYSIPGILKNAIDWGSRPSGKGALVGKPVAIMGASMGMLGTARAQYHLRQSFVFLNMYVLNRPEVMIPFASKTFDAQGNITDDKVRDKIKELVSALADWTRKLRAGSII
jgi:chromate reductase